MREIQQKARFFNGRRGLHEDCLLHPAAIEERFEIPGLEIAIQGGHARLKPTVVRAP